MPEDLYHCFGVMTDGIAFYIRVMPNASLVVERRNMRGDILASHTLSADIATSIAHNIMAALAWRDLNSPTEIDWCDVNLPVKPRGPLHE